MNTYNQEIEFYKKFNIDFYNLIVIHLSVHQIVLVPLTVRNCESCVSKYFENAGLLKNCFPNE